MADRATIRNKINRNIGNNSNERFSVAQLNESIQKGYNLATVLSGCIQKSTSFPFPSDTPYINLRASIPDYFAVLGIFNPNTGQWLEPVSVKELNNQRWDWERWTGTPTNKFIIIDFNRIGIFPYQTVGSGTFILWYLAQPPSLRDGMLLEIPDQFSHMIEDYGSADLLDLDREYKKALNYYTNFYKDLPELSRIINNLAAFDKNLVLEPYFPLGRYGSMGGEDMSFVDAITPTGTIDGSNATFTLPSIPSPSTSLLLMNNGVVQYPGISYTLTGSTITFTTDYIPQTGDAIRAWYRT